MADIDLSNEVIHNQSQTQSEAQHKLCSLTNVLSKNVVGQKDMLENLIIGLLCDGHVLIEGMPGLAKTTSAKALASGIDGNFHRIQFTPDLLPSDLIGTEVFLQDQQSFSFKKGPIFQNILLADEINRAPAKVQSALLEAMQEKQVTVGHSSYKLPKLFMVVATQNPIEQEGTYNLPEAQLDRFLLHIKVDYPSHDEELELLDLSESKQLNTAVSMTSQAEILAAREAVRSVYVDQKLKNYIVSIIQATRHPELYDQELAKWIQYGGSPRASLAALHSARAYAWLKGEQYVLPEHIQYVLPNILRHRIALTFEAQAENIMHDNVITQLLNLVAVP